MYFLDTYGMIEYAKNNSRYLDILENNRFFTSNFQLMEIYYIILREQNEELAEKYFESFALVKVEIPERTIKEAMKTRLRLQRQNKNISYVDAISYQYAKENNLKFLTGDKEFKDVENVEFIR